VRPHPTKHQLRYRRLVLGKLLDNVDIFYRRNSMEANTQHYGSIGWLIGHLRAGHRMTRKGWPKDQHLVYVPKEVSNLPHKMGGGAAMQAYVAIVRGEFSAPWVANNDEMLGGDWEMLDPTAPGEHHAE
jgi:hypothetical protein